VQTEKKFGEARYFSFSAPLSCKIMSVYYDVDFNRPLQRSLPLPRSQPLREGRSLYYVLVGMCLVISLVVLAGLIFYASRI
jgi:hypothetical protein